MPTPKEVIALVQRRAQRVSEGEGRAGLESLLKDAQLELNQRLARVPASSDRMDVRDMRRALDQVRLLMNGLTTGFQDLVVDQAGKAAEQGAQDQHDYLQKAAVVHEGQPLPIDEAAVLDPAVSGSNASIMRRLLGEDEEQGVIPRYDQDSVEAVEDVMRRGLVMGLSWDTVRNMLAEQAPFLEGAPKWKAEQVLRMESMQAFNNAGWEAMREADKQLGGDEVCRILCATFDSRTGSDSYMVHGQIRHIDEPFEYDEMFYMTPPNRPNDREIVVPHRVAWGPPPEFLRPVPLAQVRLRWKQEGRKALMPRRPPMSTVKFGPTQLQKEPEDEDDDE